MSTAPHLAQVPDMPALEFLVHLGNLDVPVWTATTGTHGREVNRPHGWQTMTADGNRDRMSGWQPGMAFSGNMGGRVVVLDGDTRNGCNIDQVEAMLDGIAVTVYAAVDTPSGGRHWYLPGHPDLPTIHATTDRDGLTGYPGLEVISYGANVFLPGTQRPKYGGRGYTILFDRLPELAETPDPESAENLAAWVAAHRRAQPEPFTPAAPWDGQPPDTRQQRYLDATLSNTARRAADAPQGERNTRLFHSAMCLGNYITGAGLDETAAINALQAAAATSGLTADDGPGSVNATIASGLRVGKTLPRAVPDPTHPQPTELTIERTPQPWDTTPTSSTDTSAPTAAAHADDNPTEVARQLWPRIDWHTLWADDTEQEWIIEPILPAGRLVALYSPPKVGKALDLNTPIATPGGWTTIGDLTPGDQVYDENGNHCNVVAVGETYTDRPCYEVTVSDGSSVIADAEHEWYVRSAVDRKTNGRKIVTTKHLHSTIYQGGARKRHTWSVTTNPTLAAAEVDLPVHPYILGYWLGDGCTYNAEIVTADHEVVERIESLGYEVRPKPSGQRGVGRTYWITEPGLKKSGRTITKLRALGVLKPAGGAKHIPDSYALASPEQRLELLRGLMDADGYAPVAKGTGRPPCELTLTDDRLAHDALKLIRSLGYKAKIAKSNATLNGRVIGDKWRITFHASAERSPFHLARKTARLLPAADRTRAHRAVKSVREVPSRPVRCIQVDSPSHLFLAGEGLIPTHNSLLMLEMAVHVSRGTPFLLGTPERRHRVLYVDFENDPRGDIRTRLENMRYTPDDLDHLDYLSYPTIAAFDTERGGLELAEAVKAYESEVVIVDTISRAVSGEENSNDTWLAFYRNTGFLLKQMGVSLIRLDHTGKDVERGQRGGSAKSGDVDAIWKLTTITRDELYRLECTDARMQIDVKELTIRRHDWPLRHTVETMPATTAGDEKKRRALDLLAEAGVPTVASRRDIAKYLRAQGVKLSTTALSQVAKQWHNTPPQPVDNCQKPVEKWSRTTPLEQAPRGPVQSGPGPLRTTEDHSVQIGTTSQVKELVHGPLGSGTSGDHPTPVEVVPTGPPPSGGPGTTTQDQSKKWTTPDRAETAHRLGKRNIAGKMCTVDLDTWEVLD